jgi:hypothetical protein
MKRLVWLIIAGLSQIGCNSGDVASGPSTAPVPLATPSAGVSAQAAQDLPGWGGLAWGCDSTKISAAYPDVKLPARHPATDYIRGSVVGTVIENDKISLPGLIVQDYVAPDKTHAMVSFHLNYKQQLYAVVLTPVKKADKTASMAAMDAGLVQKFGPPKDIGDPHSAEFRREWQLGHTHIVETAGGSVPAIQYVTDAFPHDDMAPITPSAAPKGP